MLNTQLIEHYGYEPQISMEDGLIILVKYLQHTDEVFIFDNTYLGKLKKVQEILLGYLLEIDRICRKYDIRVFSCRRYPAWSDPPPWLYPVGRRCGRHDAPGGL